MTDKMMLTLQDLHVLAATAERNGTIGNFAEVALQWAGEAQREIERLRRERDEADRRAGAAERHNAELKKDASARQSWLSKAKKEWGVDDVVSFDVVWAEALTLRAELAASKETQRRFAASYSRLGVEARDAEIERLRAELAAKQARIDALMLEHCPGEMTPEQLKTWGEHQRPAREHEP